MGSTPYFKVLTPYFRVLTPMFVGSAPLFMGLTPQDRFSCKITTDVSIHKIITILLHPIFYKIAKQFLATSAAESLEAKLPQISSVLNIIFPLPKGITPTAVWSFMGYAWLAPATQSSPSTAKPKRYPSFRTTA